MRLIRKRAEPAALTTYRQAGGRYDGDSAFPAVKAAIRVALVEEQGSICCYCLGRIAADDSMKIEHRVPQSSDRGATMDLQWSNLLGACRGAQGQPRDRQHCDTRKGDAEIALDPTDPNCVAQIHIQPASARVCAATEALQREIDDALNLNDDALIQRRKSAIRGFVDAMNRLRAGREWPESALRRELERISPSAVPPPRLDPDCESIAWWIRRRLGADPR